MLTTSISPRFGEEVANLLYAGDGRAIGSCIHCGVCSATCPAVQSMDHTPRLLLAMIGAGMKDEVLASNTYWMCASCFDCSERCPLGIHPAQVMYALKRYSLWHSRYPKDLIGPELSRRFVRTILRNGKSYEPGYAPAFIWEGGFSGLLREMQTGLKLLRRGRLPLIPSKIKRINNFRSMIGRIIPLEGIS